jgi:hypothetical protein
MYPKNNTLNGLDRDREPWTEKEDLLLGTDLDRVIAAKLGRSSTAISNRRKKLRIPAFTKRTSSNRNELHVG